MSVKQTIKTTLGIINKALKQVPNDKRLLLTSRVNDVLGKYKSSMDSDDQLLKFKKQLEFNLNFIKLSHPSLDYTLSQVQQPSQPKVKLTSDDFSEFQRLKNDTFQTQEERQKQVREEVMFSNWFQGNADPELLNKHKQLLQRQHFEGDYWQGKQKPKSQTKQYLKSVLASGEPLQIPKKGKSLKDTKPKQIQQSEEFWEKVKR